MLPKDASAARWNGQPCLRVVEAARLTGELAFADVRVPGELSLAAAILGCPETGHAFRGVGGLVGSGDVACLSGAVRVDRTERLPELAALLGDRRPRRAAAPRKEG